MPRSLWASCCEQCRDWWLSNGLPPIGWMNRDRPPLNIDWRARTATLGGSVSRRADRGSGFGTDAATSILRYGFRELDLFRVEASTAEYNAPARRVLEKLGFREEGRRRQALYRGGRRWDGVIYGLLRSEFSASAEA